MLAVAPNIFGLFELDLEGNIRYSKLNPSNFPASVPPDLIGRNFFDEISLFKDTEELRRRFRCFVRGSDAAEKFILSSQLEENPVELNVMLTRINEREFDGEKKLIIVDIRLSQSINKNYTRGK